MKTQYLAGPELEIFLNDLAKGPSTRFRQLAVCRLPAEHCQTRLRERLGEILDGMPQLGWRVRRDDDGWHYEPSAHRPELYVETHRLDGDSESARHRLHVECHRSLDPVSGPLCRVSLLRYTTGGADLLVAVHALAVGTSSPSWLIRELTTAALHDRPPWADSPSILMAQDQIPESVDTARLVDDEPAARRSRCLEPADTAAVP